MRNASSVSGKNDAVDRTISGGTRVRLRRRQEQPANPADPSEGVGAEPALGAGGHGLAHLLLALLHAAA